METFFAVFSTNYHTIVHILSYLVEIAGMIVILISVARAMIGFFKNDPKVKIELGNGLMLGIEIKIGAEVFHTLVASCVQDLLMLAIIVAIRVALTFVLHWEVKSAEKEEQEQEELRLAIKNSAIKKESNE